jgi:hypothetical protein
LYPGAAISYSTRVHVLIGEADRDFAAPAYEFYDKVTSEKAVQFVPNAVHVMRLRTNGQDAIVRAILAGAFAKTASPSVPATLSLDDWGRPRPEFSVAGPTSGSFEIFSSCGHPSLASTPLTPDPVAGWSFLPANSSMLIRGTLRGPGPNAGTAKLRVSVPLCSTPVITFQARVKDATGANPRWTNVVEFKWDPFPAVRPADRP